MAEVFRRETGSTLICFTESMSKNKKLNDDASDKEKPLYEKPRLIKLEDEINWRSGGCSIFEAP